MTPGEAEEAEGLALAEMGRLWKMCAGGWRQERQGVPGEIEGRKLCATFSEGVLLVGR